MKILRAVVLGSFKEAFLINLFKVTNVDSGVLFKRENTNSSNAKQTF